MCIFVTQCISSFPIVCNKKSTINELYAPFMIALQLFHRPIPVNKQLNRLTFLLVYVIHRLMRWNLTSKKKTIETEYEVWKLLSCSFTYHSKKIRFCSPVEKNHETLLLKVKSLNEQIFFNNK